MGRAAHYYKSTVSPLHFISISVICIFTCLLDFSQSLCAFSGHVNNFCVHLGDGQTLNSRRGLMLFSWIQRAQMIVCYHNNLYLCRSAHRPPSCGCSSHVPLFLPQSKKKEYERKISLIVSAFRMPGIKWIQKLSTLRIMWICSHKDVFTNTSILTFELYYKQNM